MNPFFRVGAGLVCALSLGVSGLQAQSTQTIHVSPGSGPRDGGVNLLNAVAGITDNSWSKRYLIKLDTGVYNVGFASVIMKPYVDIEGSGRDQTLVLGTGVNGFPGGSGPLRGVFQGADFSELRDLTITPRDADALVGVAVDFASPTIRNVSVAATGGESCWGIRSRASNPVIEDVRIWLNCTLVNTGLSALNEQDPAGPPGNFVVSRLSVRDTVIATVGGNSQNNGLFMHEDSAPFVWDNVEVTMSGGATNSRGIFVSNEGNSPGFTLPGASFLTLDNSNIAVPPGGVGIWVEANEVHLALRKSRVTGGAEAIFHTFQSGSVAIDRSTIGGSAFALNSAAPTRIGASQLLGGSVATHGYTCAGVYDDNYTFFASTCP